MTGAHIIQWFDKFKIGQLNETFEMYTVNSRHQQEDGGIEALSPPSAHSSKYAKFCHCLRDSIIRDRISLGIQDYRTHKRPLPKRSNILSKSIDLYKSCKATNLKLNTSSSAQFEDVPALED